MENQANSFISDTMVEDRKVYESTPASEGTPKGVLRTIKGPVAEWGNLNRNNRKYSEKLWDRVLNSPYVAEQMKYHTLYGEAGHPTDRFEIDFGRVSHSITDMWKVPESNRIYATIQILDTPLGRILNTLYEAGGIIGYSSRAGGSLHQMKGYIDVDENDYNFVTFDAVPYPSVIIARPDEFVSEGATFTTDTKVSLKPESHEELCNIIAESNSSGSREAVKDFVTILESCGWDMSRELSVLSGEPAQSQAPQFAPEEPQRGNESSQEGQKILETTMSLIKDHSLKIDKLTAELQSQVAENHSLKDKNRTLEGSLNESLSKVSTISNQLSMKDSDFRIIESKYCDTIRNLERTVKSLEAVVEDKETELEGLREVQEACRILKKQNSELEGRLGRCNTKDYDRAISENKSMKSQLDEAYSEISSLVQESSNLTHRAERKDSELKELRAQVASLQNEVSSLRSARMASVNESARRVAQENRELRKQASQQAGASNTYLDDLITVISSQYGLNESTVKRNLPARCTKADIYNVCEKLDHSQSGGISIVSESGRLASNQPKIGDHQPINQGPSEVGWIGATNRRGL